MKRTAPTDLNEIAGNPQKFTFYEYPAYTFDRKYENDGFQKRVITIDSGYHLVLSPSRMRQDGYSCRKGGSCPLMRCHAG